MKNSFVLQSVLVFSMSAGIGPAARANSLVGIFNVNAYFNSAGCPPSSSPTVPADGNPFFCAGPGPGPYIIAANPGTYTVSAIDSSAAALGEGANVRIWDGDSSLGSGFYGPPNSAAPPITFTHTFGDIVIYNYDWFAFDNNPLQFTTIQLDKVSPSPEPNAAILVVAGVFLMFTGARRRASVKGPGSPTY